MPKSNDKPITSTFQSLVDALPADAKWNHRLRADAVATAALQLSHLVAAHADVFATLGTGFEQHTAALLEAGATYMFAVLDKVAAKAPLDERKISVQLAEEATALRITQRKLLNYYLADDPAIGPRLKQLLEGYGYLDLAADLVAYADLYDAHHAVLARDRMHFEASDSARARTLAATIRRELGFAAGEDEHTVALVRTQIVVRDLYDAAFLAAQYLFRKQPSIRDLFEPLATAARSPRRARKSSAPVGPSVPQPE
jgi:hypothetical protein